MFSFANHVFLLWRLDVHDWSCFPLCGMTRNTCYSCTDLKSNVKICLVLTATESRTLKGRPGQQWFPTHIFSFHTSVSFTGSFSVFQTCQESQSDDYSEGSTDTEEKVLFIGCWIIIFLHGPRCIDLSVLFLWPLFFFFNFRDEKQQVCVWADGQELADAPSGRNQLCRRLRSMFIFGLY